MPYADQEPLTRFNPFDITKAWLQKDLPADPDRPDGSLPQSRQPSSPRSLRSRSGCRASSGHRPQLDRTAPGRMFAYGDLAVHRDGPTNLELPISNKPINEVHNYNKDGPMRYHQQRQPAGLHNAEELKSGRKVDPQRYRNPSSASEAAELQLHSRRSGQGRQRLHPARRALPRGNVAG